MINVIKKTVHRILSVGGYELKKRSKPERRPSNIIQSYIENPQLIDDNAMIMHSELRKHVKIGPRSIMNKVLLDGQIEIGSNTTINGPGTEFYSIHHPIRIGNFCSIARGTAIQEHNHNTNSITTYFIKQRVFGEAYGADVLSKGGVTMGSDVWVGTQCVILSGVTIGHGAVIAANSVVNEDIPPYAIVGGTPARILRYRFAPDVIEKLLSMKWWEWEMEEIKLNKDMFYGDLTMELLNSIKD